MSSTYMSSVFRSGSPRNDAGPLVERTAPTLTWAAADPAVTDAARPISKAVIVMFFGIAKSSLFQRGETCAFAHNEHRHARGRCHCPYLWVFTPIGLFLPCFK